MLTRMFKDLFNILILLLPRWEKHSDTIHQPRQLNNLQNSVLVFWGETSTQTIQLIKRTSQELQRNRPDEGLKASIWHQHGKIQSRLSFPGCDHQIHEGGCLPCLKQYLGGFYGSQSIHMNTASWDFKLEHCTVTTIDLIHRDPVCGSTSTTDQRIDFFQMEKETREAPAVLVFNDRRSKIWTRKQMAVEVLDYLLSPFKRDLSPQKHPGCHFL